MKIVSLLERKLELYKYERYKKMLNTHFKVGETSEYVQDAIAQLQTARDGIAKYAKGKGVTLSVTSADEKKYPNMLECLITDKKTKRSVCMLVEADAKKKYSYILPRIIHDPQEMLEYRVGNIAEHEDGFCAISTEI